VGTGTTVKWAGGVAADKNPGVAGHISKTAGCIGYIELTYALQNKIQYGWVQNREKKFIEPSLESVTRAADAALADIPADLRYSITDAPGADAYPISGTVWAVVYQRQASDNGQELVDFLRWMTHDGQKYASDLHYAALPEGLTKLVEGKISSIQVGK
jgi:phosphate transport system substrate-binding protein